jgi:hypothetical protein
MGRGAASRRRARLPDAGARAEAQGFALNDRWVDGTSHRLRPRLRRAKANAQPAAERRRRLVECSPWQPRFACGAGWTTSRRSGCRPGRRPARLPLRAGVPCRGDAQRDVPWPGRAVHLFGVPLHRGWFMVAHRHGVRLDVPLTLPAARLRRGDQQHTTPGRDGVTPDVAGRTAPLGGAAPPRGSTRKHGWQQQTTTTVRGPPAGASPRRATRHRAQRGGAPPPHCPDPATTGPPRPRTPLSTLEAPTRHAKLR